ncbi:MAG TPA: DNA repair protein RecO [Candidatus Omnitrophota bacterium]|nr:DNA repair protein RecO [Candidatus Omnitrophota bacterium]
MIVKTEAIVLKSRDLRETSRLSVFFTKTHGKVTGVLKGIRKDHKKFGSSVDKFSVNEIVFYQYRRSDVHLISQCDLTQFFYPIRQDYKRNMAANYALELIDAIMPAEEKNEMVYGTLMHFLHSLQSIEDIDKLIFIFQVKILHLSGFSPHLDSCVSCTKKIHGRSRFSMALGGLICPDCPTRETSLIMISKGTVSSILHVEQNDWAKALRLGLIKTTRRELKYILNNFLVYHLERRLKSARFL